MDFVIESNIKNSLWDIYCSWKKWQLLFKKMSGWVVELLYICGSLACHRTEVKWIPNDWCPAGPSHGRNCEVRLFIRSPFCFWHCVAAVCQQSQSIQLKTGSLTWKCILLGFSFGTTNCNVSIYWRVRLRVRLIQ